MIHQCQSSGEALRDQERCMFPASTAEALVQLLKGWNIPGDVYLPLKFSSDDFTSLARLPEPARTRVELVKAAVALGRLVVGTWQNWDLIQLPSQWLADRLGLTDVHGILSEARRDLEKLLCFHPSEAASYARSAPKLPTTPIAYCDLSQNRLDLLRELLPTLGIQPTPCSIDEVRNRDKPILVNCLGLPASRFANVRGSDSVLIICDGDNQPSFARLGGAVSLPCGYGGFRTAILRSLSRTKPAASDEASRQPLVAV
jgi:hypothetical protein